MTSVVYLKGRRQIATGSADGCVSVWSMPNGESIYTVCCELGVTSLTYISDKKVLLCGVQDFEIKVIDLQKEKHVQSA